MLYVSTRANSMWIPYRGCNHIKTRLNIYATYTLVRDNIHHLQASRMRCQHDKYYFLTPQRWVKLPRHSALHTVRLWCVHFIFAVGSSNNPWWWAWNHMWQIINVAPQISKLSGSFSLPIWPINQFAPKCALWWDQLLHHPTRSDVVGHAIHLGVAIPVLNFWWSKKLKHLIIMYYVCGSIPL